VNTDFTPSDMELTYILVMGNVEQSQHFYLYILEATGVREFVGTSYVLNFQDSCLPLVTGCEPTRDKPTVTFAPPPTPDNVSDVMTIRVPDCQVAYHVLKSRGAEFLTPQVN